MKKLGKAARKRFSRCDCRSAITSCDFCDASSFMSSGSFSLKRYEAGLDLIHRAPLNRENDEVHPAVCALLAGVRMSH